MTTKARGKISIKAKRCPGCGRFFSKRPHEGPKRFQQRTFCNRECQRRLMVRDPERIKKYRRTMRNKRAEPHAVTPEEVEKTIAEIRAEKIAAGQKTIMEKMNDERWHARVVSTRFIPRSFLSG